MALAATLQQVQNLYIAYYGRPADAAGQTYWADRIEAEGLMQSSTHSPLLTKPPNTWVTSRTTAKC